MYRKISDFISDYKSESENTLKIFNRIDRSKKSLKVNENIRSMERLAWHIAQTLSDMMHRTGLADHDDLDALPIPADFEKILEIYNEHVKSLLKEVGSKWKDDEMEDKMEFFGEKWAKGFLLQSIITHEIHHRGQLTVVMRYFGNPVPGIYGPSREEWVTYHMPAME